MILLHSCNTESFNVQCSNEKIMTELLGFQCISGVGLAKNAQWPLHHGCEWDLIRRQLISATATNKQTNQGFCRNRDLCAHFFAWISDSDPPSLWDSDPEGLSLHKRRRCRGGPLCLLLQLGGCSLVMHSCVHIMYVCMYYVNYVWLIMIDYDCIWLYMIVCVYVYFFVRRKRISSF